MPEETPSEHPTPDHRPGEADREDAATPGRRRGGFFARFRRGRTEFAVEDETLLLDTVDLETTPDLQPARPTPLTADDDVRPDVAPTPDEAPDAASDDADPEPAPEVQEATQQEAQQEAQHEPEPGAEQEPEQAEAPGPSALEEPEYERLPNRTPDEADSGDDAGEPLPTAAVQAPLVEPADLPPTEEPRVRQRRVGISAHLAVLTALATIVVVAFLLIEPSPRWVLLLGAGAVVIGLDGTLRHTWRLPFSAGAETAPFLFVPALYMLAVPVLIEHNVPGELVLPVGLLAGLGFGALAWGETASVRAMAPDYDLGRVLVTAGTYLAGFAVFSLTYVFDVNLSTAVLAVGLASTMLAVEVLREGEIDPQETLGFAVVTGVIMAEVRLLLYYVPLETYLAGLTLLLAFYLATGLLHSHVTRAFSWAISVEYGGIAAAGLGLVVAARMAGLA